MIRNVLPAYLNADTPSCWNN